MIRQAVVLAAGRGTRMGALTRDTAKPLLEVAGVSLLERVLSGLRDAGIEHAAVVTGYRGEQVEEAALTMHAPALTFVRQDEPCGTAHAIGLARNAIDDDDFFFGWTDIVVAPNDYARVVADAGHDAVLGVNHIDDPTEGAAVYFDEGGRVQRIIEKPPPGTSTTTWNNAGLGVLGPAIWPHLDAVEPSPRGELELADALTTLLAAGGDVVARPIEGPWFDVGTPKRLSEADATLRGPG